MLARTLRYQSDEFANVQVSIVFLISSLFLSRPFLPSIDDSPPARLLCIALDRTAMSIQSIPSILAMLGDPSASTCRLRRLF